MKKTLLIIAVAFMAIFASNAQKIWNFGTDATNWPISAGIGNGDGSAGNPVWPVSKDGLQLAGPVATPPAVPNVNMGQVEASVKTFTTFTFANRFKFNGAGYPGATDADVAPTVSGVSYFTPTQRYVAFNVSGNSVIYAIGITGSNTSSRKIFVTDGVNLIGTMSFPGLPSGTPPLNDATVNYTGPATKIYLFCNQSINLYYLSATNYVVAGVNSVLADKGITFNGTEITNKNGLDIEVFNILGKKVAGSRTAISTANFQKGVYIVRAKGTSDSLKISI